MKYFTSGLIKTPHAFFSRLGGVSKGLYKGLNFSFKGFDDREKDNLQNVVQNEKIVLSEFKNFKKIIRLNQIHSGNVIIADEMTKTVDGDAVITYSKDILVGVITADCVPILLHSEGAVAAIHAGWNGMIKHNVIQNTVKVLKDPLKDCGTITAAIGPCIRHYEIKEDVAKFVPEKFLIKYKDSFLFDIASLAKEILNQSGIQKVDDIKKDTLFNEDLFFSCRRAFIKNEPNFGCQLSVIGL